MFIKHVSGQLSAYFDGELEPQDSQQVAEHLLRCQRCRTELETVKFGGQLAALASLVSAPGSLWDQIDKALDATDSHTSLKGRRSILLQKPVLTFATAVLLTIFVAGFALLYFNDVRSLPATSSWRVARLNGAPRINSSQINDQASLGVGQWLETDKDSRAQIDVATVGQIEIDPNTRVRLIETNQNAHRLELQRGRMSARISAPPRLFFVNTPSGVAEDLGCAYTLAVDENGNSLLRVTAGWVSLQLKDRESLVPAGAACATRPGLGPGTPYFEDAPENFRSALSRIDLAAGPISSATTDLNVVLNDARRRDAMTLWYLIFKVEGDARAKVYDRLSELVPPPPGVDRQGVLSLDKDTLARWRVLIDGLTGEPESPSGIQEAWWRIRNSIHRHLKLLRP